MYDLRWRFDYSDRPSRFGMWNRSGVTPETQAWRQNKSGMIRASIEGKNIVTREIKVLAECNGQDFVNFEWMAVAVLRSLKTGAQGTTPITRHIGLKLVRRYDALRVFADGKTDKIGRTHDEQKISYATFGR